MSDAHAWSNLPAQLESALPKVNDIAQKDDQLINFTTSNAIEEPATFGIKSGGSDDALLGTVSNGKCQVHSGSAKDALFTLVALPEQCTLP